MWHFTNEIFNSLHFWAVTLLELTKSLMCLEGTGHWWVTSISVWLNQITDSEEERVTFVMIKDFKGRVILLLLGTEICDCLIHSCPLSFSLLSVPALSRERGKPRGKKDIFFSRKLTIFILHTLKANSVCIKIHVRDLWG